MHRVFDNRRYLIPFRSALLPQIFTDVLVVGSGVAGMRAAMAASAWGDVIVAAKGRMDESNTAWAQGGVAAVCDEKTIQPSAGPSPPSTADEDGQTDANEADSRELHVADTLGAGAGLCDDQVVREVVDAGDQMMTELLGWGMPFDRDPQGRIALGREGGHSRRRVLHASGDATGAALASTLNTAMRENERIRVFDDCFVLDLVTLEGGAPQCVGAVTHHPKYGLQVIWAAATILASGGCGKVFRESTNPNVATGDGLAMAYRAGAELADMAFMQFHPTTLYVAGAGRSLITEAVRGEGALLLDHNGERFMPDYHEMAELAPRDIVSRAILAQVAKTHHSHVYLDCRPIGGERFAERFPAIFEKLRKFDLDPASELIPIYPSAHYMIGGVRTDLHGRTSLRGLYAAGEVACTGLHGANRLASNSLLEGLVFGQRSGEAAREMLGHGPSMPMKVVSDIPLSARSELDVGDVRSSLRSVMWRQVGIQREGDRLDEVMDMINFWARYTLDKIFDDRLGWELQNLLFVGALMTRAARWRAESRGTHYRMDCPDAVDAFAIHDVWRRGAEDPTHAASIVQMDLPALNFSDTPNGSASPRQNAANPPQRDGNG